MKTYEKYNMYQIKVRTRRGVETVVCKSALAGGVPFVGWFTHANARSIVG